MRRIVYSMMVSLDGYIETPDHSLDWVRIDEELHTFANDQAREEDVFVYGRRLYEVMSAYWPTADREGTPEVEREFARIWRDKPKVVFSRTLKNVDWNSRLLRDDLAAELERLKMEPGGSISIGGADLAAGVERLGLIDEYQPIIQPVVLGAGTPFFARSTPRRNLRLLETKRFGSGVTYLRYERA